MNLEEFYTEFSDEESCRDYFELLRWPNGRQCPHCGSKKSYDIVKKIKASKRYECSGCKRQFTVTTKTALHSTKLPLKKWLQAMYLVVTSSKGLSSVVLARLIGVTQPTAWRMGHVIRLMMESGKEDSKLLTGVVEIDEMYVGGAPPKGPGIRNKRGKGTAKQCVFIAVERHGPMVAVPVKNEKAETIQPVVDQYLCKNASLMSDGHRSYKKIGKQFVSHDFVNHSKREFSRGQTHCNTAESVSSIFERARIGVFHYLSKEHTFRYLNEFIFRWDNREPHEVITKKGMKKIIMVPVHPLKMIKLIIAKTLKVRLLRTINWGLKAAPMPQPFFGR